MSKSRTMPHTREDWDGYTIDEIRYLRAYTAARLEIARERLQRNSAEVMSEATGPFKGTGLLSRILGTLSYLDIALVTYKLGKSVFRVFRSFRRK